jgi:hypothetical protein
MTSPGLRSLSAVFVGSLLFGAVSFAVLRRLKSHRSGRQIKVLSENEFTEVMRILAKRIFLQLFSFAQVSARIVPKSDENNLFSIRFDNPAIRDLLEFSQQSVLEQFHLSSEDLEHAQSLFCGKGNDELDKIVDTIPTMFDQFASGSFPVLPTEVVGETSQFDSAHLLDTLSTILTAKSDSDPDSVDEESIIRSSGYSDTIPFYNDVAKRMRSDTDFRNGLVQILMKNQTLVRSRLDE